MPKWLAAVVTILVEGGALLSAYVRFVKRSNSNSWMYVLMEIICWPYTLKMSRRCPSRLDGRMRTYSEIAGWWRERSSTLFMFWVYSHDTNAPRRDLYQAVV